MPNCIKLLGLFEKLHHAHCIIAFKWCVYLECTSNKIILSACGYMEYKQADCLTFAAGKARFSSVSRLTCLKTFRQICVVDFYCL